MSWIFWQIQQGLLPPGEPFRGLTFSGGSAFAPAGRTASVYFKILKSPSFAGISGDQILSLVGGAGYSTPGGVYTDAGLGLTTSDVIAGNCYFGIAGDTALAGPALLGIFDVGTLGWTMSFGADVPVPPPTAPSGTIINPVANNNPGKIAGIEDFQPVTFTLLTPRPSNNITFTWRVDVGSPLVFVDTGTTSKVVAGGALGNPANPYGPISSGLIRAPVGVPIRQHNLEVQASSGNFTPNPLIVQTTLRVRAGSGGVFAEF